MVEIVSFAQHVQQLHGAELARRAVETGSRSCRQLIEGIHFGDKLD